MSIYILLLSIDLQFPQIVQQLVLASEEQRDTHFRACLYTDWTKFTLQRFLKFQTTNGL